MKSPISVLIVEDEIIVAADLQESLEQDGYTIAGIANNGLSALQIMKDNHVDLVLLDINIKGEWDGIETSQKLLEIKNVPYIYLTAYADDTTFQRAKETHPSAYLLKPFFLPSLRMAIEIAFNNFRHRMAGDISSESAEEIEMPKDNDSRDFVLRLEDAIFIRQSGKHVKVKLTDIVYLVADSNHVHIHTESNHYVLRRSMQSLMDELHSSTIIRVHRSYAINTAFVEKIKDNQLFAGAVKVPLGRNYKAAFLEKVNLF
jgi:DNA-binding LytR/AlgR family response regulator